MMKTMLNVATALATAMLPLVADVARAGQPAPYLAWEAPQQGIYLQVDNPYPRSWIRPYPTPVYPQPLGQTDSWGRFPYGDTTRSRLGRPRTVIVAPKAETIIIYQEGPGSRQQTRIIPRDRVYREDTGFDRDLAFPSRRDRGVYQPDLNTYPYRPPASYGNSGSRTFRSCYPSSWRNSPFNRVAARPLCD